MNSLQKKVLMVTLVLAIQYGILIQVPGLLVFLLVSIALTLILGVFYTLGIKFQRNPILGGLKFLTLPLLFNFGSIFFLRAMLQPQLVYVLAVLVFIVNFYLLIALKRIFSLEERAAVFQRNIIISAAFLSIFLSISALYRFFVTYSADSKIQIPLIIVVLAVALIFYLVSHFLAWENGIDNKKFWPYNLIISFLAAEVAWVSSIWVVNYPVFSSYEKASLGGSPLPAVILVIIFYFTWGIISHKASRSLTKNVIFEYFLLTLIFLAVLFISTKWLPQV